MSKDHTIDRLLVPGRLLDRRGFLQLAGFASAATLLTSVWPARSDALWPALFLRFLLTDVVEEIAEAAITRLVAGTVADRALYSGAITAATSLAAHSAWAATKEVQ